MERNAVRPVRVVVIGKDEIDSAGCEAILARHADVGDIVRLSHDEARLVGSWADVDTVVLDPVDRRRVDDQLPGIALAARIRAERPSGVTRVVLITGAQRDDVVRIRAREAEVDAYVHRSQLLKADELCRVALTPSTDDGVPLPVDLEALHRLGVSSRTRVNAGVAAAFAEQLVPESGWVGPRGRDRHARRVRFNERARLCPVSADGLPLERNQTVPSLAQIQRFVAWATRIDGPAPTA